MKRILLLLVFSTLVANSPASGQSITQNAVMNPVTAQSSDEQIAAIPHWDVYYYVWNGHNWQTQFYGPFYSKCAADSACFNLQRSGYTAWITFHAY